MRNHPCRLICIDQQIIYRLVVTSIIVLMLSNDFIIPVGAGSIPNPGFETFPQGGMNDWTWPSSDWVWDNNIAHSGTHSARVYRGSGSETGSLYSAYIPVQPSTNYTLTYWMRTQDATYWPSVMLYQYTTSGTSTGPSLIAYANIGNGTRDWNVVNYHFQTMPDATQLRLRLYLYTSTTGTFWFDDFSLDQGTPALFPFQAGFPVVASGWVTMSSPSVSDLDHNGDNELLIGAGSAINGWNKTGAKLPGFPLDTGDRSIVAQIALADLNHDNRLEIVAGTRTPIANGQCRVFAWQDNGALLSGWPKSVDWNTQYSSGDCWITSVVLADIDDDHSPEILASTTNNITRYSGSNPPAVPNLYAWHANGSLVAGNWPNWYSKAGFYGAIAAGDLNGDGIADIIAGRDHHYLNAYSGTGISMPGWPIETYLDGNSGNYQTDYRLVHGLSEPILADLDGDGTMEYIDISNVDGPGDSTTILNSALLVLEPDGTRRPGWETPALGVGTLTQVDLPQQAPVVADINGDGRLEIIAATNDGWIRAYKADKTLLWSFNYTQGATLFASEPVIGDINGDGALEIVFSTHVPMQAGGNWDGPVGLWALKADGSVVPGFPLPIPTPGVRAAPTLADLDGDGKLEILAATMTGQIFVWDTPAPYDPARLPWPTGRHDLQRSGTYTWQTLPPTPTPTSTATATNTPTKTTTPTAVATFTNTLTHTPTRTVTSTATRTATLTATRTATSTATRTATSTATRTATLTVTRTATSTSTTPSETFGKIDPANLAAGLPSSLSLNWASLSDALYYLYCLDTVNNSTCDTYWTYNGSTNATVSGLTSGATYYWQVVVVKSNGSVFADNGAWWSFSITGGTPTATAIPSLTATSVVSPTATLIPTATQTVLTPPASPTPTSTVTRTATSTSTTPSETFGKIDPANLAAGLPSSLSLNWASLSDALYYLYCLDTVNNSTCDTYWTYNGSTTATVSGLTSGATYYWQVVAVKSNGSVFADSGAWWSFLVSGTAPTQSPIPPTATLVPTATQTVLTPPASPTPTSTATRTATPFVTMFIIFLPMLRR